MSNDDLEKLMRTFLDKFDKEAKDDFKMLNFEFLVSKN